MMTAEPVGLSTDRRYSSNIRSRFGRFEAQSRRRINWAGAASPVPSLHPPLPKRADTIAMAIRLRSTRSRFKIERRRRRRVRMHAAAGRGMAAGAATAFNPQPENRMGLDPRTVELIKELFGGRGCCVCNEPAERVIEDRFYCRRHFSPARRAPKAKLATKPDNSTVPGADALGGTGGPEEPRLSA